MRHNINQAGFACRCRGKKASQSFQSLLFSSRCVVCALRWCSSCCVVLLWGLICLLGKMALWGATHSSNPAQWAELPLLLEEAQLVQQRQPKQKIKIMVWCSRNEKKQPQQQRERNRPHKDPKWSQWTRREREGGWVCTKEEKKRKGEYDNQALTQRQRQTSKTVTVVVQRQKHAHGLNACCWLG